MACPVGRNRSRDVIVSFLRGILPAHTARFGIFSQNLALYNKNYRVLLSQALCVVGALGNLMFKLLISPRIAFVVNIKFPRATYQTIVPSTEELYRLTRSLNRRAVLDLLLLC